MMNTNDLTPEQIAALELKKDTENSEAEKREAILKRKREMRNGKSVQGFDNPFDIPKEFLRKGFHYFIANDRPGRIQSLMNVGYDVCKDPDLARHLGLKPGEPIKFATGSGQYPWAILMMIEEELWQDDQRKSDELAAEKMGDLGSTEEGLNFVKDAELTGVKLDKKDCIN